MRSLSIPCDDECCCCCFSLFNLPRHIATFLKYVFILLITWLVCLLLMLPHLRAKIVANHEITKIINSATLQNFFGFTAVYRICFSVGAFHLFMSMFLVGASSDNGARTSIHHGFWPVKTIFLLGITATLFLVSSSSWLFPVVMYIAMTCGFIFSLVEVLLLVDFAQHYVNGSSTAKSEDNASKKCRGVLVLFSTLAMYLLSIICMAILYVMFANNTKCKANKFFIIFISCHCIIVCIMSMLPVVQRVHSNAGSFQSALVILFAVFSTWSAVTHQPYNGCSEKTSSVDTGLSIQTILTTVVVPILLFYASLYSSPSRLKKKIWPITERKSVEDNRQDEEAYSYSVFHLMMFLSYFHIMVTLTKWHSPSLKQFKPFWSAVWVKMAACSVCMWVYLWTLLSPLFSTDSDATNEEDQNDILSSPTLQKQASHSLPQKESPLPARSGIKETSRPPSIFTIDNNCQSTFTVNDINEPVRVTHGSMSRKGSLHPVTPNSQTDQEMLRLQSKVMRLQEKIAKLQTKVAGLQGLQI